MRAGLVAVAFALGVATLAGTPAATAEPAAQASRPGPVGWDTFRHPERLAEIGTDSRTLQFSSFDRTGSNNDGFGGNYSCLRLAGTNCVIAEQQGAGEIDSIWFTRDNGDVRNTGWIKIELDGQTVVDTSLQDVVDGKLGAPFTYPLVANADQSSGGVYIKVPMTYRESMRVTVQSNPFFYHVTYRTFASSEGIATFDKNDKAEDVLAKLKASGTQDPKPQQPNAQTATKDLALAPGATATIATAKGSGALTALGFELPQLGAHPVGTEVLQKARLRATFDGERTIDSPLGEFYGSGLGLYNVKSFMFGMTPATKKLDAWWLMPYAKNAKIELYNGSSETITGKATTTTSADAKWAGELANGTVGHFRATSQSAQATFGRDVMFLETVGRGRVMGVTQTVNGGPKSGWRLAYLEGDERVFVDGATSPALHGTGTEDFYEGGWYFNRDAFTTPTTGTPVKDRADCVEGCTGMYRLLLAEGINFDNSMRFSIEHGQGDDEPALEASTTYWYGLPTGSQVWSDSVDVGSPASEKAHDYKASDVGKVTKLTSRYEGIDGPAANVTLDARATWAQISFKVAVPAANQGVTLRRTSDQAKPYQSAKVAIDGVAAGTWYQPLGNADQRWLDDSFVVPASLTAGKKSVTVTLSPAAGSPPWSAAAYQAIATLPIYRDRANPDMISGVKTSTGTYNQIELSWLPGRDDVYAPRYQVYASTTSGFKPAPSNLIGTTMTPGFTHYDLAPRETWYYKVRAVDRSGRVGLPSAQVVGVAGDIVRIEAERLLPPVSAEGPLTAQGNCCGIGWSGGAQLWFTPTEAGKKFVVEFEIKTAGKYELTTQQTLARDYGINTLAIDGVTVGEPFDAYAFPDVKVSPPISYGEHDLTVGKHTLTVTVGSKNAASISYMAGIDYLQFQRVD